MSDTDDTDILLSIPPHTFLYPTSDSGASTIKCKRNKTHKKKSRKSKTSDDIAFQVDKIKLSLEKLENIYSEASTIDLYDTIRLNYSVKDISCNPYDLYSSSDCSNISILSITSAINMEDKEKDESKHEKKEDKFMLSEIDAFLKNIEYINPASDLDQSSYLETPTFNKTPGHKTKPQVFTPEFTSKHTKSSKNLMETDFEKRCSKDIFIGDGFLKNSVPDCGLGMRDIMYRNDMDFVDKPHLQQTVSSVSTSLYPTSSGSKTNMDEIISIKTSQDNLYSAKPNQSNSSVATRRKLEMNVDETGKPISEQTSKHFMTNVTSTPNVNIENKLMKPIFSDSKLHSRLVDELNLTPSTVNDYNSKLDESSFVYANFKMNSDKQQPQSLPSLSNIWNTADVKIKADLTDQQKFEEERIKREHCERSIQDLQKKILEQQQNLAVVSQSERFKDETILKLKNAVIALTRKFGIEEEKYIQEMNRISSNMKSLLIENDSLKKLINQNNDELMKANNFSHEYRDKFNSMCNEKDEIIEKLQNEINNHNNTMKRKDEMYNELKESNSIVVQLNKQVSETMSNMRLGMDKLSEENAKLIQNLAEMKKCTEALEDEITLLKTEKAELSSKITEERAKITHLESQKTKLQNMLDSDNLKYKTLEMEFDSLKQKADNQKEETKLFYQKQVETIVMSKVNEFQSQLNAAEALMENEMQNKEKEIALQFAKQLHKVEHQHKSEINILEEKHKEEIKLYRLQLAQSSQTIEKLESNLNSYKNRRGHIAAQLHNVMENQWKEALKILTYNGQDITASDSQSIIDNLLLSTNVSNSNLEEKECKKEKRQKNDSGQGESKSGEVTSSGDNKGTKLTEEEVQNYVKMLLQKAPGISEILGTGEQSRSDKLKQSLKSHLHDMEYPTSDKNIDDKKYRRSLSKKPWK